LAATICDDAASAVDLLGRFGFELFLRQPMKLVAGRINAQDYPLN